MFELLEFFISLWQFYLGLVVGYSLCAILSVNRKHTDEDVKFYIEKAIEENNRK